MISGALGTVKILAPAAAGGSFTFKGGLYRFWQHLNTVNMINDTLTAMLQTGYLLPSDLSKQFQR